MKPSSFHGLLGFFHFTAAVVFYSASFFQGAELLFWAFGCSLMAALHCLRSFYLERKEASL